MSVREFYLTQDCGDLVKSLRRCGEALEKAAFPEWDVSLYTRAADMIEKLQAENKELLFRCGQAEAMIDKLYGNPKASD